MADGISSGFLNEYLEMAAHWLQLTIGTLVFLSCLHEETIVIENQLGVENSIYIP
jgi:hypothetical protein